MYLFFRTKMRRHKVFLFGALALCVLYLLQYCKALHHMLMLTELYTSSVNLEALGFLWRGNVRSEMKPLPGSRPSDTGLWEPGDDREDQGNAKVGRRIGHGGEVRGQMTRLSLYIVMGLYDIVIDMFHLTPIVLPLRTRGARRTLTQGM